MIEITGDFWAEPCDARCIMTNGHIKKNGTATMGRGFAREARDRINGIDAILGRHLSTVGNHVSLLDISPVYLLSFPVRNMWWEEPSGEIITRSCGEIDIIATRRKWAKVVIGIDPDIDISIMRRLLDDRFVGCRGSE